MPFTTIASSRKGGITLWIIQAVLAMLFLFAGGMKLVMPIAALTQQTPLPGAFIRLIGVLEVLGALGLVLPGVLKLNAALTPLAAAGLVIIMSGAVGATLTTSHEASAAIMPVIVGVLLAVVTYGRVARLDFNRVLTIG